MINIQGYENYFATKEGKIFSSKNKAIKELLYENVAGYLRVKLYKNGKGTKVLVHRIIATCFKKPVTGKDFVNHKDLVKTNNSECNLEWCTRSENIRHSLAARKITHKHTV